MQRSRFATFWSEELAREAVELRRLDHADGTRYSNTRAMSTQTVIKLASYRLYVSTCFVLIARNFVARGVLCARREILFNREYDQTSRQESVVMKTVVELAAS